jgi:hypothetical protein
MAFPADSVAVITQSRFHSLMTFINCSSRISLAEWESMFGAITEAHPWGVRFWDGFRFWMVNRYKNCMRKYRHLCNLPPDYAYFETPERFSKAQAGRAKNDECNRGSGGLRTGLRLSWCISCALTYAYVAHHPGASTPPGLPS